MNKSTILLIALLLILGAIALFLLPSDKEREASYKTEGLSFAIDSASVTKIELRQKGKSVTIENIGGRWTITSPMHFAADPAAVTQLIGGVSKFKVGSLISSNPEKQHIFQVDSTGTTIVVTDRSGKTSSMIVGKMGPSFSEVYFRLPSSKDVYLGQGIDSWSLNKEVRDWREKTIVNQPSESINNLTYTLGKTEYAFHRDSTEWRSGSKTMDASTMSATLNSLSNLRADDFVDSVIKLESHPVTVAIRGAQNVNLNLYPSLPDSSKYFVQSSASPQMYVISKWTAQQLLKPIHPQYAGSAKVASTPSEKKKETPPPQVVEKKAPEKVAAPITSNKLGEKKTTRPPPLTPKEPAHETVKQPQKQEPQRQQQTQKNSQVSPAPKTETPKSTTPFTLPTPSLGTEDEGDLTVHTVSANESMTTIAKKYNVSVEQILKWNLLKSIKVRPGQELYIYVKK